jgi:hypothetical protein
MVNVEEKIVFILDDNEAWLRLFEYTIIPHFSLRNIKFHLNTNWSQMLESPDIKNASLFLIDFFLKNSPVKSQFSKLDQKADITGLDLAITCKSLSPNANIKIVTCGQALALDILNKSAELSSICEPKDIVTKPVSLEVVKLMINELS